AAALQVRSHSARLVDDLRPGVVDDLAIADRLREVDARGSLLRMLEDVVEDQLALGCHDTSACVRQPKPTGRSPAASTASPPPLPWNLGETVAAPAPSARPAPNPRPSPHATPCRRRTAAWRAARATLPASAAYRPCARTSPARWPATARRRPGPESPRSAARAPRSGARAGGAPGSRRYPGGRWRSVPPPRAPHR